MDFLKYMVQLVSSIITSNGRLTTRFFIKQLLFILLFLDGCHIEVSPPLEHAVDYYNYKGWYSVILLAAVDYRYRFTYINIGATGRNNDSYVYENSQLKNQHDTNDIFKVNSVVMNGNRIPVMLLGDSAFRLSNYLMKPYPFSLELAPHKQHFNYMLSKTRRCVENSFGQLKARFRRVGKGLETSIDNSKLIIRACCILHNICNEKNDKFWTVWLDELAKYQKEQPSHTTTIGNSNLTPNEIRDTLAEYLLENKEIEE